MAEVKEDADDDAGQQQRLDRQPARHERDQVDPGGRQQRAREREAGDAERSSRRRRGRRSARPPPEGRTAGDAEHGRLGQRIAREPLKATPATASAPPASAATATRGSRICSVTIDSMESAPARPASARTTAPGESAALPTNKGKYGHAHEGWRRSPASASVSRRRALT